MNTTHTSLKPLSTLLKDTWSLYRKHMNSLALVSIIPFIFGAVAMTLRPELAVNHQAYLGILAVLAVFNVLHLVFSLIMPVALITTIDEMSHGRAHHVNAAYKKAFSVAIPYLFILILSCIVALGGSVLLIIPGIIVNTYLMFVVYVFLLEGKRGMDALIQSAWYVRGFWLAVFGRKISIAIFAFIALLIFTAIAGALTFLGGFNSPVLAFLIDLFAFMFIVPFTVCFTYLVYRNLRAIKEHTVHHAAFAQEAEKIFIILMVIASVAALTAFTLFVFWPGHFSGVTILRTSSILNYH